MKSTSAAAEADLQGSSQLKELLRFAAGRTFEPIVRRAYRIEGGTAHRWLRRIGQHYLGLKASCLPRFLVLLLFKISYAAMHSFARHSTSSLKSIGEHPIGFDDLRVECFATDANTASVYVFGVYDGLGDLEVLRRYVSPHSVALDIGANVGIYTLALARCVGPNGLVFSYEPCSMLRARLLRNIEINGARNVVLRTSAVGSRGGMVGFADLADATNIGLSHVDESNQNKVAVTTLDHESLGFGENRTSFIKIDTEGYELEVLRGARALLEKHRPTLLVESSLGRLHEILALLPYAATVQEVTAGFLSRTLHPVSVSSDRDEHSRSTKNDLRNFLIAPQA